MRPLRFLPRAPAFLVTLVALLGSAGTATASDTMSDESTRTTESSATSSSATAAQTRARALFEQGNIHYSLGEYDQAIRLFREAYELTSAPALLFNIAQAERLGGHCPQALEVYRHFVRLVPESTYAADARAQIDVLSVRCGAGHTTSADPPKAPPSGDTPVTEMTPTTVPAPQPLTTPAESHSPARSSTRHQVTRGLLIGGLVLAAGAGVLYLWNDSRYDRWTAEDTKLRAGPSAGDLASAWVQRQNANDGLLRSIWHVDTTVGIVAGASAACVLAAATLGILPERGVQLSVSPGAARLAWIVTWP